MNLASAWPVDQLSVRDHGINGWFVPQREGGLRWIGKAEAERQLEYYEAQEALEGRLSTNTVNFYLYKIQLGEQARDQFILKITVMAL